MYSINLSLAKEKEKLGNCFGSLVKQVKVILGHILILLQMSLKYLSMEKYIYGL